MADDSGEKPAPISGSKDLPYQLAPKGAETMVGVYDPELVWMRVNRDETAKYAAMDGIIYKFNFDGTVNIVENDISLGKESELEPLRSELEKSRDGRYMGKIK